MNPSKQQIFALVTGDLEEKIAAKWPESISHADFNAMTNGSFRRRSGLIKDVSAFLTDNPEITATLTSRGRDLCDALAIDYAPTRDALFVGQFATDFEVSFGRFCGMVVTHIEKLEAEYGEVGASLKEKFLAVVTAPSLRRSELEDVIGSIQKKFTDHWMSDERGEVTKAHQKLDMALQLGLLQRVAFVPYETDRPAPARS
jgi:hypothetical protein